LRAGGSGASWTERWRPSGRAGAATAGDEAPEAEPGRAARAQLLGASLAAGLSSARLLDELEASRDEGRRLRRELQGTLEAGGITAEAASERERLRQELDAMLEERAAAAARDRASLLVEEVEAQSQAMERTPSREAVAASPPSQCRGTAFASQPGPADTGCPLGTRCSRAESWHGAVRPSAARTAAWQLWMEQEERCHGLETPDLHGPPSTARHLRHFPAFAAGMDRPPGTPGSAGPLRADCSSGVPGASWPPQRPGNAASRGGPNRFRAFWANGQGSPRDTGDVSPAPHAAAHDYRYERERLRGKLAELRSMFATASCSAAGAGNRDGPVVPPCF